MKKYLYIIPLVLAVIVGVLLLPSVFEKPQTAQASTPVGASYFSVAFAPPNTNTSFKQSTLIASTSSNWGILGSVIITGANTGYLTIYDATTTDATKRTTVATTSLRVITQIPASAAAQTYTFDAVYQYGLVAEWIGNVATSTITWRPN